jgi:flagellar biosynthesis protein FliR
MSALESLLVGRFVIFALVLARTGGLVLTAPIFGYRAIPLVVRIVLAVALSLLVTSVCLGTSLPPIDGLGGFGLLLVKETLLGMLLGVGVSILLAGVLVAGQLVSQLSGVSLGDAFSTGWGENVSPVSQLFTMLALAVFVASGGHRLMTEALLDTFVWAPPGHAVVGASWVDVLTGVVTQSFSLGIRAAAPIMIALLVSNLVLGLVGRTLPQINMLGVGVGLNAMLMLGLLCLSLGVVAWTFQGPMVDILVLLRDAAKPS